MVTSLRLRKSRAVADLILSRTIYDSQPFEAIPYYHIIVANFDYLLGNIVMHIFTSAIDCSTFSFPFAELPYSTNSCPSCCSTDLTGLPERSDW
jgi:hypothetical protein